ncbi:MAG: insulinase family protein [Betaproteobacteria bacterium]|nr:MAG: insulinase family protein [Betaproteobacteria bacterium]
MQRLAGGFIRVALVASSLAAPWAHALLPIQEWRAASGARVLFVENHDLPMLDVSVDFPAGSGYDSKEKAGLASYTQRLLRLGAGGLSENEVSQRIADVGARLGGRFDTDRAGIYLRTLSSASERDRALDVMALVLQRPEFSDSVLAREKARGIAGLKEADTKPDTLASRAFSRMVYREHPYGLRAAGEVETVASLTRADLLGFYRRHYLAERAIVAIMGDATRADAERIAEALTAKLPRAEGDALSLPNVESLERAASSVLPHPASQAHILIGGPGIRRGDPDYFPLFVGNYILGGGGFVSRLTEEVRQKRGLAYSVYSTFAPLLREGPFQIGLQTRGDQAQAALAVVNETLKSFVENGPTEGELEEAKNNLIGGFPLRIDSNRKIHEYLATIGFYDLPLTYLDDFVGNIKKVTVADIKAAFARRVRPDRLVTVVVGGGVEAAARR